VSGGFTVVLGTVVVAVVVATVVAIVVGGVGGVVAASVVAGAVRSVDVVDAIVDSVVVAGADVVTASVVVATSVVVDGPVVVAGSDVGAMVGNRGMAVVDSDRCSPRVHPNMVIPSTSVTMHELVERRLVRVCAARPNRRTPRELDCGSPIGPVCANHAAKRHRPSPVVLVFCRQDSWYSA
jgi:hypothetical protein